MGYTMLTNDGRGGFASRSMGGRSSARREAPPHEQHPSIRRPPRRSRRHLAGDALVRRFGKPGTLGETIGESWECWDENPATGGPYAGESIAHLRAALGAALMGELDVARAFPVLTKFIDARQPLSVQVHPDDAYAQRVEHQPNGKTECWVVLEAEPSAGIVLGWKRDIDREEYVRRVADGTLGDVLRKVPVHAGDAFYLPAGTVHSIGAGIVLYETQQTSDLTYRIFDWNRVGADGKPRRLDAPKPPTSSIIALATNALSSLTYALDGTARTAIVADPRFVVERVAVGPADSRIELDGMPLVVTGHGRSHRHRREAQASSSPHTKLRSCRPPSAQRR